MALGARKQRAVRLEVLAVPFLDLERIGIEVFERAEIHCGSLIAFLVRAVPKALHAAGLAEEVCDLFLVEPVFGEIIRS